MSNLHPIDQQLKAERKVDLPQFYETPFPDPRLSRGSSPPKGPLPIKVWEGPHPDDPSTTLRALLRVDESIDFESLAFDALGQPAWRPVIVTADMLRHIAAQFVKHISNLEQELHKQSMQIGALHKIQKEKQDEIGLLRAERSTIMAKLNDAEIAHAGAVQDLRVVRKELDNAKEKDAHEMHMRDGLRAVVEKQKAEIDTLKESAKYHASRYNETTRELSEMRVERNDAVKNALSSSKIIDDQWHAMQKLQRKLRRRPSNLKKRR